MWRARGKGHVESKNFDHHTEGIQRQINSPLIFIACSGVVSIGLHRNPYQLRRTQPNDTNNCGKTSSRVSYSFRLMESELIRGHTPKLATLNLCHPTRDPRIFAGVPACIFRRCVLCYYVRLDAPERIRKCLNWLIASWCTSTTTSPILMFQ